MGRISLCRRTTETGGEIVNNLAGTGPATLSLIGGSTYAGIIADSNIGAGGGILALAVYASAVTLTGDNTYSGGTFVSSGGVIYLGALSGNNLGTGNTIDDGLIDVSGTPSLAFA